MSHRDCELSTVNGIDADLAAGYGPRTENRGAAPIIPLNPRKGAKMNPQEETSIKSMDAILEALNAAHEAPVEIARSMAWSSE